MAAFLMFCRFFSLKVVLGVVPAARHAYVFGLFSRLMTNTLNGAKIRTETKKDYFEKE